MDLNQTYSRLNQARKTVMSCRETEIQKMTATVMVSQDLSQKMV